MLWEARGEPGGVDVSEQPELPDNRFWMLWGVVILEDAIVPGITNGTKLDIPDGVLTPCTNVLGSPLPNMF